jgi:hypothetical protein
MRTVNQQESDQNANDAAGDSIRKKYADLRASRGTAARRVVARERFCR